MRVRMWIIAVLVMCMPHVALGQQSVNLAWDAPTANVDGSPLTDLAGYRVYMDFVPIPDDKGSAAVVATTVAGEEVASVAVTVPGTGSLVYFRVSAVDVDENESALSNQVSIDFLSPASPTLLRFLQGLQQLIQEIIAPDLSQPQ